MRRAVGLVRVSTHLQTEENGGTGIPFQKEKINQYSQLNDLKMVKMITDVASGGLETRDGIEILKQMIKDGLVDVVLIWNVSRAFRSMIYFTQFYELLKNHKVELVSVSEGLSSFRKEHQMIYGIMMSVASYEKSIILERLSSGRITKVKSGVRGFGSKIPFGYTRNQDGDIVVDETSSKVVQYIFKKFNSLLKRPNLTKNKRTRHLLKLLKERGFTYYGKDFTRWNIRDILKNPFYIGEMKYGQIKTKHQYKPLVSKRLFNQICM